MGTGHRGTGLAPGATRVPAQDGAGCQEGLPTAPEGPSRLETGPLRAPSLGIAVAAVMVTVPLTCQ